MKNTKIFLFLFLAAALAWPQEQAFVNAQPLPVDEAAALWTQVSHISPAEIASLNRAKSQNRAADIISPDKLPGITGVTIQVEAGPNGEPSRRVELFIRTPRGRFVARTIGAGGQTFPIATFYFESGNVGRVTLIDGHVEKVLPWTGGFQHIEVFRQDGGTLERTVAFVASWASPEQGGPEAEVVSETILDGRLAILLRGRLGPDTVVTVGRNGDFAEFRPQLGGVSGVAVLPANVFVAPGLTTLTICSRGVCGTTTFRHLLQIPGPGKG